MDLELLKLARRKRGVTQEKLSKDLGFKNKSSYCLIEKGKTSISVDIANQIIKCLDLSKEESYQIFYAPRVQETSTNNFGMQRKNPKTQNLQLSLFGEEKDSERGGIQ